MELEIEKHRAKRILDALENIQGKGTSLISLLVASDGNIDKAKELVINEQGTASNIKSRVTRQHVENALKSLRAKLLLYRILPKNGLVCYFGESEDGETYSMAFEPFRPLRHGIYRCDSKFHTLHLREQLADEAKIIAFILICGDGYDFYKVSGSSREKILTRNVELPKKQNKGGQSKQRFETNRIIKGKWFIRDANEDAIKNFINSGTAQPSISGLIIAGSANFKLKLEEILDDRLKRLLIKTVDVQYRGDTGMNELLMLCADDLKNNEIIEEQKLCQIFFDQLTQNSKLAIYGIKDIHKAMDYGSGVISMLVVWSGLKIKRYQTVTGGVFYGMQPPEEKIASEDFFLDWIMENYRDYGCALKIIEGVSSIGNQIVKGFDGIVGILRFEIQGEEDNITDVGDNVGSDHSGDEEYFY